MLFIVVWLREMQYYVFKACTLRFWKGKGTRHFLGHQGNDQGAQRQLPPWSIRPAIYSRKRKTSLSGKHFSKLWKNKCPLVCSIRVDKKKQTCVFFCAWLRCSGTNSRVNNTLVVVTQCSPQHLPKLGNYGPEFLMFGQSMPVVETRSSGCFSHVCFSSTNSDQQGQYRKDLLTVTSHKRS